ncbi:Binding-protein-dependent transport system inner membrane component [uncultured archaeon]|nr:Binding-protein-dependent transport system inner membrane component [uncultured archaeon]
MKINWKAAASLAIAILLWAAISDVGIVQKSLFPGPEKVLDAAIEWCAGGRMAEDVFSSLWRITAGIIIGSVIGVGAGLLTGRIVLLEESVGPLFHMLRAFPPVAMVPLVILWFGIGDTAKVFSISFAVFFTAWLSALIGTKAINSDYIKTAKVFSKSAKETYEKVIFPAIVPFIVNGIRVWIGTTYTLVFVSEMAGASSGIGYQIAISQITYRADMMIAGLLVLGILAYSTDFFFVALSRRVFHWADL